MDASISGLAGRVVAYAVQTPPPKETPKKPPTQGLDVLGIGGALTSWWQVVTENPETDYQKLLQAKDQASFKTLLDIYAQSRSFGSLYQLASLLESSGSYGAARYIIDRILERGEKETLQIGDKVTLALAQIKIGEYAKGIAGLKELARSLEGEELFQVKLCLAGVYLELMMHEETLQELTSLSPLQSDNLYAKLMLYQAYSALGRREEARQVSAGMDLIALQSMVQDLSFTPFSGDGEAMLIYAQLLLGNCRYEEAEGLLTTSLQNGLSREVSRGVINLLAASYQKQGDLSKLEALAEQAKSHNFVESYYQIMGMIALSRSVDPKMGKEEQARFAAEATRYYQAAQQLGLERIASFPTTAGFLLLAGNELFNNNSVSTEVLNALRESAKKLPPGANRIRAQIALVELRKALHLAAASGHPQKIERTIVDYRPLAEFPGSSDSPFWSADASQLELLLSLQSGEALPYEVRDQAKFYQQITELARGLERFKGRDLGELSVQEALYLAAQVTEEIVGTYGEGPAADETCTPLEEKISRGDYNEAACRHYTIIFIAVFNALKERNPALASYYAFSGFSQFHTFPMVATVRQEGGGEPLDLYRT